MGPTAAPETSSGNLPRTPCKISETRNQYSFHGESLKSRLMQFVLYFVARVLEKVDKLCDFEFSLHAVWNAVPCH
jgi:hypothetical protein